MLTDTNADNLRNSSIMEWCWKFDPAHRYSASSISDSIYHMLSQDMEVGVCIQSIWHDVTFDVDVVQ